MRPGRVVSLVVGCLVVLPAIFMFVAGGLLLGTYLVNRDDGYVDASIGTLESETVAVTAEDVDLGSSPGDPDWLIDALDVDVRLRATPVDSGDEIFIGIGPESDVDTYLAGVAHDEIDELDDDLHPLYRRRTGGNAVAPPVEQDFWVSSDFGAGTREIEWEAASGRWAAVLMNADGSPGLSTDVDVGVRGGLMLAVALGLFGVGALLAALGATLIVLALAGVRHSPLDEASPSPPVYDRSISPSPVALRARLDPELSRWKWLIKWFLAIPHFVILVFLWIAFVVLTVVAGVAIVFTGRYPRSLFDVNVGILRWTWRVSFYTSNGGIGTDRYPDFGLHPVEGEPASLTIAYTDRLSRPLVFVKWLLALPHLIFVAILGGGTIRWLAFDGDRIGFDIWGGGGILGLLVLVAGVILLFSGRYPPALFDLIVGLNRWIYRTVAYVALMTDEYPPFRLDQGGEEPSPVRPPPVPDGDRTAIDLDDVDAEPLAPART